MDTKEAIEFIRLTYLESGLINEKRDYNEIIELLQQGEKYRQMWEELYLHKIKWNDYSITVYMQELEKKYFPKEIN